MVTFKDVVNKLRRTYYQSRYADVVRNVLGTPALFPGAMPFTALSMVHKKDVLSYLVAIKSFARYANPRRIVVVCDPSIAEDDRKTLKSHIPHIELRRADEFTHADIPRGGTWERLYAISEYARNDYVVQLDADTITLKEPAEVLRAIQKGNGFVLGERPNQEILTREEAAVWSRRFHTNLPGIQCVVEAGLDAVELAGANYVRGCSGFTGFPASSSLRDNLLEFSKVMSNKHGERWKEWSTEQVTSNYLVASLPGTMVLPFPKYATPDVQDEGAVFSHFMGYIRFVSGRYVAATRNAISMLNQAHRIGKVKQADVLSMDGSRS
jgi:hypothetical protein